MAKSTPAVPAKTRRKRRHRRLRPEHKPIGARPGLLAVAPDARPPEVQLVAIDKTRLEERPLTDMTEVEALHKAWPLLWLDIVGLDVALLEQLSELYGVHRLALEDVASGLQRPKAEAFEDYHFVVLRRFSWSEEAGLTSEQVALFFGDGFVISFREHPSDVFEPVRQRIRGGRGRLRSGDATYLAYALMDTIVDGYFPLLEVYGERIENLEDQVIESFEQRLLTPMRELRREISVLRRYLWPARDALAALAKVDAAIPDDDRPFFRDCYDHTVQLIEVLESYREMAGGLLPLYASMVGNRAAEISRVLTMVATVFIPLSFVAGLYGMNFDGTKSPLNMPELRWTYGYPAALALMATVVVGMLFFFRRKGWLGGRSSALVLGQFSSEGATAPDPAPSTLANAGAPGATAPPAETPAAPVVEPGAVAELPRAEPVVDEVPPEETPRA